VQGFPAAPVVFLAQGGRQVLDQSLLVRLGLCQLCGQGDQREHLVPLGLPVLGAQAARVVGHRRAEDYVRLSRLASGLFRRRGGVSGRLGRPVSVGV